MKHQAHIFDQIKHAKRRAFLAVFSECGNLRLAAHSAQVQRRSHYCWLKNDAEYAAAFAEARDDATDKLEEEVWRRAVEGTRKLVVYKGKPVMVPEDFDNPNSRRVALFERQYSDVLLIFLLKTVRPAKYRNRTENRNIVRHVLVAPDESPPDWLVERAEKKSETERGLMLHSRSESTRGEPTASGV